MRGNRLKPSRDRPRFAGLRLSGLRSNPRFGGARRMSHSGDKLFSVRTDHERCFYAGHLPESRQALIARNIDGKIIMAVFDAGGHLLDVVRRDLPSPQSCRSTRRSARSMRGHSTSTSGGSSASPPGWPRSGRSASRRRGSRSTTCPGGIRSSCKTRHPQPSTRRNVATFPARSSGGTHRGNACWSGAMTSGWTPQVPSLQRNQAALTPGSVAAAPRRSPVGGRPAGGRGTCRADRQPNRGGRSRLSPDRAP